jgi:hypothetical protein
VPAGWLFSALGTSWSKLSPATMLFGMAVTMAVPMAAWMHYRGHSLRLNVEMVASMFLPTLVIMALLIAHALKGMGALMVVEHLAMSVAMLIAMLLVARNTPARVTPTEHLSADRRVTTRRRPWRQGLRRGNGANPDRRCSPGAYYYSKIHHRSVSRSRLADEAGVSP